MNEPDYSHYDEAQLRQVLARIDAQRYPERVRAVHERLAELEGLAADRAAQPPCAGPVRGGDLDIIRRVGKVLLAIGVVDTSAAVMFTLAGVAYPSTLNLMALAAGAVLWSGSLRSAVVVRWLAMLSLPGTLILTLLLLTQPLELSLIELKLTPVWFLGTLALSLLAIAVVYWTQRQLGREAVLAARAAAGRKAYGMALPLGLGAALALAGYGFSYAMLHGERAERAMAMVASQYGPQYRYHVSSLNVVKNASGDYVSGAVLVWSRDKLAQVPVSWRE
ncbi:hypothetical protein ACLB1G_02380 [Oxalobacteraceae bacterium A2-2]